MTPHERFAAIERLCALWCARPPQFVGAVAATCAVSGYARSDVERQLLRICEPMTARALEQAFEREVGEVRELAGELLHLAPATVPGLLIESMLWGLAACCNNQCRRAREDTSLLPFIELMREHEPQLAECVEVVVDPRWSTATAAAVYGSDETVELVRGHLAEGAPIAAYGSREGIAVISAHALASDEWADALADDIVTFGQRGCMSPAHLFVLSADEEDVAGAGARLSSALTRAVERHLPAEGTYRARREADAKALGQIAGGAQNGSRNGAHTNGDAASEPGVMRGMRLSVLGVANEAELSAAVGALGSLLQTAVLACPEVEQAGLSSVLEAAGCTRVCSPGTAHLPPFEWPHDGIGRLAPLFV